MLDSLPPEFDPTFYSSFYEDLRDLDERAASTHYVAYGRNEGRSGNAIRTRADLLTLIPEKARVLEIGPYYSPLLRGENVRYIDIISREQMIERANKEGHGAVDPPHIDYVSPTGNLSIIKEKFDFAISSYCIEHQADLVRHLDAVQKCLNPGGRYFILSPDKRYCHDHFRAESTIAEVLDAYYGARRRHTLKEVIEHYGLNAHNDNFRHWDGDHGDPREDRLNRLQLSIQAYLTAKNDLDVHSWYFTPDSMREILSDLGDLGLCKLKIERCYDTRRPNNDFWMVLRSPSKSIRPKES